MSQFTSCSEVCIENPGEDIQTTLLIRQRVGRGAIGVGEMSQLTSC